MRYISYFASSTLISLALFGYALHAHGERLLGRDRAPAEDRPATAKAISDGCIRGAREADQVPAETLARFCGCYAGELLNTATVRDLKSTETYRFQIKADRASLACRAKLNLASK